MRHWSLASTLLAVGLIALALAAVRIASPTLANATIYGTYGILVLATVGAVVRRSRSGAWRGFALFGWAYFLPVFVFGSRDLVEKRRWPAALQVGTNGPNRGKNGANSASPHGRGLL